MVAWLEVHLVADKQISNKHVLDKFKLCIHVCIYCNFEIKCIFF